MAVAAAVPVVAVIVPVVAVMVTVEAAVGGGRGEVGCNTECGAGDGEGLPSARQIGAGCAWDASGKGRFRIGHMGSEEKEARRHL